MLEANGLATEAPEAGEWFKFAVVDRIKMEKNEPERTPNHWSSLYFIVSKKSADVLSKSIHVFRFVWDYVKAIYGSHARLFHAAVTPMLVAHRLSPSCGPDGPTSQTTECLGLQVRAAVALKTWNPKRKETLFNRWHPKTVKSLVWMSRHMEAPLLSSAEAYKISKACKAPLHRESTHFNPVCPAYRMFDMFDDHLLKVCSFFLKYCFIVLQHHHTYCVLVADSQNVVVSAKLSKSLNTRSTETFWHFLFFVWGDLLCLMNQCFRAWLAIIVFCEVRPYPSMILVFRVGGPWGCSWGM